MEVSEHRGIVSAAMNPMLEGTQGAHILCWNNVLSVVTIPKPHKRSRLWRESTASNCIGPGRRGGVSRSEGLGLGVYGVDRAYRYGSFPR